MQRIVKYYAWPTKSYRMRLFRKAFLDLYSPRLAGSDHCFTGGTRPKRRHNAEFEKAGNEYHAPRPVDKKSKAQIERATMERDMEIINAIRQERKMLKRNDPEAQEYRKTKEQENKEVSRGEVINHLSGRSAASSGKEKGQQRKKRQDAGFGPQYDEPVVSYTRPNPAESDEDSRRSTLLSQMNNRTRDKPAVLDNYAAANSSADVFARLTDISVRDHYQPDSGSRLWNGKSLWQ